MSVKVDQGDKYNVVELYKAKSSTTEGEVLITETRFAANRFSVPDSTDRFSRNLIQNFLFKGEILVTTNGPILIKAYFSSEYTFQTLVKFHSSAEITAADDGELPSKKNLEQSYLALLAKGKLMKFRCGLPKREIQSIEYQNPAYSHSQGLLDDLKRLHQDKV